MPAVPLTDQCLRDKNTLRIAARAREFYAVQNDAELAQLLQLLGDKPFLLLGGGSNVVLQSEQYAICVQQCSKGIRLLAEDSDTATIAVAAGEEWHGLVSYCLQQGWHGLENLALIPGTVGAAPIQNIGAYGVEVSAFITKVMALQRGSGKRFVFNNADCAFSYRDSVFKQAYCDALVISELQLRLFKTPRLVCDYAGLSDAMQAPTAKALYEAVIAIRRQKLPDPARLPNVGSFFKNPIVSAEKAAELQGKFPELVQYPQADGRVKLAAGWLVDQAGWKGLRRETVGVHAQQALVLVNHSEGSGKDILRLAQDIQASVAEKFTIQLQIEPRIY